MAGRIALDLKKFKHLKSDDKSTTLKHPDGHILTIANKSLSPDFQKQLSALSNVATNNQTSDQAQEAQQQNIKLANGGKTMPLPLTNNYSTGGNVDEAPEEGGTAGSPTSRLDAGFGKVIQRAKGGPVPHMSPSMSRGIMPGDSRLGANGGQINPVKILNKLGSSIRPKAINPIGSSIKGKNIKPLASPEKILNIMQSENNGNVGGTIRDKDADEVFAVGSMIFGVEAAKKISQGRSNAMAVCSNDWSNKINVEEDHAINADSTNPVLIAQIPTENELIPLLFDGHHRMYRAISEGKSAIPAYVFTPEESLSVMTAPPDLMYKLRSNLKLYNNSIQRFAKGGQVKPKKYEDGGGVWQHVKDAAKWLATPGTVEHIHTYDPPDHYNDKPNEDSSLAKPAPTVQGEDPGRVQQNSIEQQRSGSNLAKGGRVCEKCGGKVKMYADPTNKVSQDDTAPVAQSIPNYSDPNVINEAQAQEELHRNQETENIKQKRLEEIYNDLAANKNPMKSYTLNAYQFGPQGQEPQQFSPETAAEAQKQYSEEEANNAAQIAQAQQEAIKTNQARTSMGLQPIPVPNVPNGPQIPGSMENPPLNTPPTKALNPSDQPSDEYGMNSAMGMMQEGYNQREEAISNTAKAQAELGQQQSQVYQNAIKAKTDALNAYQDSYNELDQERKNHIADIQNSYIDPNKYWDNHSKVMSGIGMILAGFNPSNSPNAAVNFLKYQMDQNMTAQAQNLNTKNNLLAANIRQFGNLKDATDMTRLMQSDVVQYELNNAAAKASSPLAKSAALNASGQLKIEFAPLQQQFAMRQAMMKLANNNGNPQAVDHMLGYMRVVNPEMAKETESRYVPGVGLGSTPIPPDVRGQLISHQNLATQGQDLFNYAQTHMNLVPGTAEYNYGVTKAMSFQQAIREGLLGTVFRESEKPLLEKFVTSNPAGALKMLTTEPRIKAILDSNEMQLNNIKRGYGLPVRSTLQSQTQSTIVTGKDGKQYQRQGNYMVPVK